MATGAQLRFKSNVRKLSEGLKEKSIPALYRVGGLLNKNMKQSIRTRKGTKKQREELLIPPSKAGTPPNTRPPKNVLRRSMSFEVDKPAYVVRVGPRGSLTNGFAQIHEFGGRKRVKNSRRTIRRLGDGGEVRDKGPRSKTTKKVTTFQRKKVSVTYATLTSDKMVNNANKLNSQLYGPKYFNATFPARPFAKPTLDRILPDIPKQYANILK